MSSLAIFQGFYQQLELFSKFELFVKIFRMALFQNAIVTSVTVILIDAFIALADYVLRVIITCHYR